MARVTNSSPSKRCKDKKHLGLRHITFGELYRLLLANVFSKLLILTIIISILIIKRIYVNDEAKLGEQECIGIIGQKKQDIFNEPKLGNFDPTYNICRDDDDTCVRDAANGECENNPRYMLVHCKLSCDACETKTNPEGMKKEYQSTKTILQFGVEQTITVEDSTLVKKVILATTNYMNRLDKTLRENCENRQKLCAVWAASGECHHNPTFMVRNCAPSCQKCDLIQTESLLSPLDEVALSASQVQDTLQFGVKQTIEGGEAIRTKQVVIESISYIKQILKNQRENDYLIKKCQNRHKHCSFWAGAGLCDDPRHSWYMKHNCAPSCQTCEVIDFKSTSPSLDESSKSESKPKDPIETEEQQTVTDNLVEEILKSGVDDNKSERLSSIPPSFNVEGGGEMVADNLVEEMLKFGVEQSIQGDQAHKTKQVVIDSISYLKKILVKGEHNNLHECRNRKPLCAFWAVNGECIKNPTFMLESCSPSCQTCDMIDIKSQTQHLTENQIQEMLRFGVEQTIKGKQAIQTKQTLIESILYMKKFFYSTGENYGLRRSCRNKKALCAFWAGNGECDNNLTFMVRHCAPSCRMCDLIGVISLSDASESVSTLR